MKVQKMSPCPRCQSIFTGKILPADEISQKSILLRKTDMLKRGQMIKYVSPKEYRDYYNRCDINAFCFDCGYCFRGEIITEEKPQKEWNSFIKENQLLPIHKKSLKSTLKKAISYFV